MRSILTAGRTTKLGLKMCAALFVFGLTVMLPSAFANTITLPPGTSTNSVPSNLLAFPVSGLLANTGFEPFVSGTFSGTFEARAYLVGTSVDFFYIVTDDTTSTDSIDRLASTNFTGFSTAVSFDTFPSGGITPSEADVSAGGGTVGFNFLAPTIGSGQRSFWVEIDTNAPSFTSGTANVSGVNGEVASDPSLDPAAVPEPATLGLLACGLAFLGIAIWRRSAMNGLGGGHERLNS
jgi:PEP-CTERM motif